MKLTVEPHPVLAICLNPAWQKTLIFKHLTYGDVNRASQVKECGGGKGVNVVRVFKNLGLPVALAGFAGGETGRKLKEEIVSSGARALIVDTVGVTRCCMTVISQDDSKVSELIEPSCTIDKSEQRQLKEMIESGIKDFGAVVFSGTVANGISPEYCAELAGIARESGVPFILDAFKGILPMLEKGVTMLKINSFELSQLSEGEGTGERAAKLLAQYPNVEWLAVTDGSAPAMLFTRGSSWKITVPRLPKIFNTIGAGDCCAAIMTRRISEGIAKDDYPKAFAEALACASASCMTDIPSVFNTADAEEILKNTTIQKI